MDSDFREDYSSIVKFLRLRAGFTQVHVAKSLSIARQTYLDVENGVSDPKLSILIKLSELYGVDIGAFVPSKSNSEKCGLLEHDDHEIFREAITRLVKLSDSERLILLDVVKSSLTD